MQCALTRHELETRNRVKQGKAQEHICTTRPHNRLSGTRFIQTQKNSCNQEAHLKGKPAVTPLRLPRLRTVAALLLLLMR